MHPELAPLEFLIGTWTGSGHGTYPTIEPFTYTESVTFAAPPGKPFLAYSQRTSDTAGDPLHAEAGYLRPVAGGCELVIAQPTGIVEVHDGSLDGTSLRFRARVVAATATAVEVTDVERNLIADGDVLEYELLMTAVGQPHQVHLRARLVREV